MLAFLLSIFGAKRQEAVAQPHALPAECTAPVVSQPVEAPSAPSLSAADLVAQFEGFSAVPYFCPAGVLTIGYGSTRGADGGPVKMSDRVTPAQARGLLTRDLAGAASAVARRVTVPLTAGQHAALCSFIYNVGEGRPREHPKGPAGFAGSTLLRKLNAGDYAGAADEFAHWTRGGGRVLPGLVKRREAERRAFVG